MTSDQATTLCAVLFLCLVFGLAIAAKLHPQLGPAVALGVEVGLHELGAEFRGNHLALISIPFLGIFLRRHFSR